MRSKPHINIQALETSAGRWATLPDLKMSGTYDLEIWISVENQILPVRIHGWSTYSKSHHRDRLKSSWHSSQSRMTSPYDPSLASVAISQKGESLKLNLERKATQFLGSTLAHPASDFSEKSSAFNTLWWRPNPCSDQYQYSCQTHQSHEVGIGMLLHKNIPSKTRKVTVWTNSRDNYRKSNKIIRQRNMF